MSEFGSTIDRNARRDADKAVRKCKGCGMRLADDATSGYCSLQCYDPPVGSHFDEEEEEAYRR
jgi:hypothetical protein